MRILILNGSPRPKGNTKQMIQAFCEGLEEAGHEYGVYDVCKMKKWPAQSRDFSRE